MTRPLASTGATAGAPVATEADAASAAAGTTGPAREAGTTGTTAPAAIRHPGVAVNARGTLIATLAATFVALMNYTAPLLTVPDLSKTFHTSVSGQAWLLNGVPLGLAVLLLIAGSLADDFGRRRVFLTGTVVLGITIGLSAVTHDTLLFTITRVAQGGASAAILASSLGLIVHAFPAGPGRVKATGIWGATVSAGIALGPLLAGGLNGAGWQLLYVVLGAAALLTAAYAARVLTESRAPRRARPDVAGALALGLASTSLLTALTLGRDGWLRAPVLLLLAGAVVLLGIFTLIERRAAAPLVDLKLLRHAPFQASVAGGLFTGLAVIGFFSYLPALLERALGLSVLGTASLVVLWAGTATVVALQAKRMPARIHARHQLAAGFLFHAIGILTMLGAVDAHSEVRLLPGFFIAGVGSGLLNAALPRLSVESVPPNRAAMGSGANNTARYIGSSVGVSISLALITSAGSPGSGADLAIWVMSPVAVLGSVLVMALRGKQQTA